MAKKHVADELQALSLQGFLARRGLPHLRVRRYGVLLIIESGATEAPNVHMRFRRHGAHIWTLEIATHTGGWQPTPLRGQIEKLVEAVQANFPWTLAALP